MSASTCALTGWQAPQPSSQSYIPITWSLEVQNEFGDVMGHRTYCYVAGLSEGSNPLGWWRIKVVVQDLVDTKGLANAWDDGGQTRVQFLPAGWASWGDAATLTPGQNAGDANSVDFLYNDTNGYAVFLSQWFYTPVNGNPQSWRHREVVQSHYKPRQGAAWVWVEQPVTADWFVY